MNTKYTVRPITLAETQAVRLDVLRRGTPAREANYDGDDDPSTVHIGAETDGCVVATSTWLVVPWQLDTSVPAVQLRGMAVLDDLQNSGVGRALIEAGVSHARTIGARYVWAKARDSAIYFYERCGFAVVGEQFMEPASGMPHHLVVLKIR